MIAVGREGGKDWLEYPLDRRIKIIGCGRGNEIVHLRWASDPTLGFPPSGYYVLREGPAQAGVSGRASSYTVLNGGRPFLLPDTSFWAAFAADVSARQPAHGDWFPAITEEDLGWILDPIRLVDSRTPSGELPALVERVADFLGDPHASDPDLAAEIWGFEAPASLASLLSSTEYGPRLIAYYRERAMEFLWALALRPEYAALLGLYAEDDVRGMHGAAAYHVVAELRGVGWVRDASGTVNAMELCRPPAPTSVDLWRTEGLTQHPDFARWPAWTPDPALAPPSASGETAPAELYVPKYGTGATAMRWAVPTVNGLIHHGAYLFAIERHEHGAATAAQAATPSFPAGPFKLAHPGSYVLPSEAPVRRWDRLRGERHPFFVDMREGAFPELEGWVAYRVWGINLFGIRSATSTDGQIRHRDEAVPPAPLRVGRSVSLAESGSAYVIPSGSASVDVDVEIGWDDRTDLLAPDCVEFRVYAGWGRSRHWECEVAAVLTVSELRARLTIEGGVPFAADELVGLRIALGSFEYTIKANTAGPSGYLETTLRRDEPPPTGRGVVLYFDAVTTPLRERIAVIARPARVTAHVTASSAAGDQHAFDLALEDGGAVADAFSTGVLYVHVLGHGIRIDAVSGDRVLVTPPSGAGSEWWSDWRAVAGADAAVAGSPVILYPDVGATLMIALPTDLGTLAKLQLAASAADDATYVVEDATRYTSSDTALLGRTGNESAQTPLPPITIVSEALAAAPSAPSFDPSRILWAEPATDYDEDALYQVTWTATSGLRYQVWRATDVALALRDRGSFASGSAVREFDATSYSDERIRELAADPDNEDLYVPVGPTAISGDSYEDRIPGKSPMRVVYRVRPIDEANRSGEWSDVIGPIHVAVITPPAKTQIREVVGEAAGQLTVRWSQLGTDPSTVFELYRATDATEATDRRSMDRLAELAVGSADLVSDGSGRYGYVDATLTPGRTYYYRVRALRRAQDPSDESGAATWDIAGPSSEAASGQPYAEGPLAPPVWTSATYDAATGMASLAWTVEDAYERLVVLVREVGTATWRPLGSDLAGTETSVERELAGGKRYEVQLKAYGVGRVALSDVAQLETN